MVETGHSDTLLAKDLPLVRVKMTSRGPRLLANSEQIDDRKELMDVQGREWADRGVLPMSTGVPILPAQPAQPAQITAHPDLRGVRQNLLYKSRRFVISNAGTSGGAADWIVNGIWVNAMTLLEPVGDVTRYPEVNFSGTVFATNGIDKFARFIPSSICPSDIVIVRVTYIGRNDHGCPFFGALVGSVVALDGAVA